MHDVVGLRYTIAGFHAGFFLVRGEQYIKAPPSFRGLGTCPLRKNDLRPLRLHFRPF
jgi:hypothetical protein